MVAPFMSVVDATVGVFVLWSFAGGGVGAMLEGG